MQIFKRCRVSSEDVVKYASVCIALAPLDQQAFWKLIRKTLVFSLVKHHLLKQLTAGKKQVRPSTTPNPIKGKKLTSLGKSYEQLYSSSHKLHSTINFWPPEAIIFHHHIQQLLQQCSANFWEGVEILLENLLYLCNTPSFSNVLVWDTFL